MEHEKMHPSGVSAIILTGVTVVIWLIEVSLFAVANSGYERGEGFIAMMLLPLLPIFSCVLLISGMKQLRLGKTYRANKAVGIIATSVAGVTVLTMIVVLLPK